MSDEEVAAAAAAAAGAATAWRETLPEDIRGAPELAKYPDVAALAKGHLEQSKLVGRKGIVVPGADAKPEDVAAYRAALGVPESPDKYQITRPEIAVDSMVWDEAAEKEFLGEMHKAGAPPAVVQAAITWYGRFFGAQMEQARQETLKAGAALRQEWGANYDANRGRANRFAQEYGGDEFVDFLIASGLGRHPLTIKAFARAQNDLIEHGAIAPTGPAAVTPEAAQQRITELRASLAALPEGHAKRETIIQEIIAFTNAAQRRRT